VQARPRTLTPSGQTTDGPGRRRMILRATILALAVLLIVLSLGDLLLD